jgi:hypothetical protein
MGRDGSRSSLPRRDEREATAGEEAGRGLQKDDRERDGGLPAPSIRQPLLDVSGSQAAAVEASGCFLAASAGTVTET